WPLLQHAEAAPPARRAAPARVPRLPPCTERAPKPTFISCSGRRHWVTGPSRLKDQSRKTKEVILGPFSPCRARAEYERKTRSHSCTGARLGAAGSSGRRRRDECESGNREPAQLADRPARRAGGPVPHDRRGSLRRLRRRPWDGREGKGCV